MILHGLKYNCPNFSNFLFSIKKMAMLGKSSDVVGQVHRSGGHFYASFCIRAFSKAQHISLINLITLMNKSQD